MTKKDVEPLLGIPKAYSEYGILAKKYPFVKSPGFSSQIFKK